jgi:peptidoglycan hydrolase-like protein with peptidoglycan-binding domain/3D (Asp-Asp-Asp) domain-containing protein
MKLTYKHLLLLLGMLGLQQICLAQAIDSSDSVTVFPYEKTFVITAYYSPVEGQTRYLRGSLAADKKLNGNGVHGADGTPVYAGMIAAPSSVPFGTKMQIPGIGIVAVHDRGGAIVKAGERNQSFDRLDIWMGSGDQGLNRALQWGRRTVTVMVYGIDDTVNETVDMSHLDENFKDFVSKPTAITQAQIFIKDLGLGDSDPQITTIKQKMQDLGYFDGTISDQFDAKLYQAVIKFQLDYQIIDNDDEFGAGYLGPQTRKILEKAINGLKPGQAVSAKNTIPSANAASTDSAANQIQLAGNGLSFLQTDLKPGDSGQAVLELQIELKKLNLFGIEPTGYYGDVTTNAVFKLQQNLSLVGDKNSTGSGNFGPLTRQKLSQLVNERIQTRQIIADNTAKAGYLTKK